MLFYVQMRWNIEGRLSEEELWDLETKETEQAQKTVDSGMVVGLFKVAAQRRVIGIVDVESIEELDRTAMGRLPMREYLEFEQVWPLRDYEGFAEDVKVHYKV
ncbi:MAG: muconolactone Delta-isomerase family protein [Pleurocapsa sp. MO_226.B13]|nr:muconolactone Delta-isomerase family protein [Pleurocapsa sp. MO_226.B13]